VSPLISARTNEEWDLSVRVVLERAITLSQKETVTVEERARITLEAVSHLWLGWSLDLIIKSCRASLEHGTPIVIGKSGKDQARQFLATVETLDGCEPLPPPELQVPEGLEELLEVVRG
jgi:hypothetical protein